MPRYRKIRRRTLGKDSRKMAGSRFTSIVTGSVAIQEVMQPTVVASSLGTSDVFENADTKNMVSPNSVIKYINLTLEGGVKDTAPAENGWVEYGLVRFEEQSAVPTVPATISANTGTQTLGELLDNHYRDKSIWNGAVMISREIPLCLNLHLKIPDKFCKCKRGAYFMFFWMYRSVLTTDTTSETQNILSWKYKTYI